MRKQFKKGVAILSAVSMVAAGISYVPQNVKADAPAIAVQDSEEGVDYSSLTYTQVGEKDYYVAANNDDFPIQEASDFGTSIHIVPSVAAGTRPIWPAFTDATLNGESIENTDSKIDGAGIFVAYSDLKDNAYNVFEATSAVKNYKFQIIIKAGNPDGSTGDKEPVSSDEASSDTTTTTTTEPTSSDTTTTTTTEPASSDTTTTTTTTTTEAPEVTTPAKVLGLTYAGNETLPFYFAWQGVAGANGYNVYLDGKLITKVEGVTYEFSKDLFAEAREYIIAVAAVNEAGEGTKTEYKYTVESKEPDSTKNEETDSTKNEETTSTKNEETDSTKNEESNSSSSTEEDVKVPVAVTGLAYTGTEEASFKFSWKASEGAESYNVYLNDKLVKSTIAPEYSFNSALFEKAGTYTISVEAVNKAGKSDKTSIEYVVKEPASSESTDESKDDNTKVTMPSDYDAIENNADFGFKFTNAPAGAKAITSTDQGDKLYIAFEATEGFNPDYTEIKVNGTSVDVSKGTGIKLPKSLLTKKVNEVVILDKDGKEVVINVFNVKGEGENPATKPEESKTSGTDESKTTAAPTTVVTMPSDYDAIENNADFGFKFTNAPAGAKAITSTDQGDKLYIAFEATEGFNPDYTEIKVNGTSVDVSKGTGIKLPKSLLTKKVNEVVILDKDGKEVVLNVFNVNGEGEIPTSPSVTEPDVTSADVTSADVTSPDASSADVTTPDLTKPDVTTTSTEKVTETSTKEDVKTTTDSGKDESTAKPTVKPTTPKATTAKPTVKPTTAKPKATTKKVTKKVSLKQTKVTKKVTKKLSSKKVKLTFKKVKGAKKYTVQVSTSKKFKKVLYKKTVKKTKVTLSSKKLKGKKKLYVRVKAVGAKKWSKAVKIKVK